MNSDTEKLTMNFVLLQPSVKLNRQLPSTRSERKFKVAVWDNKDVECVNEIHFCIVHIIIKWIAVQSNDNQCEVHLSSLNESVRW